MIAEAQFTPTRSSRMTLDGGSPRDSATKPSGRVVFDERGNSVWQWRGTEGASGDIDTVRIRCLQEQTAARFSLQDDDKTKPMGGERPYFESVKVPSIGSGRRRSLDDMRRLSEEIKRRREAEKSRS